MSDQIPIQWSSCKTLYCLPSYSAGFWLGVPIPGEIPADQKNNSGLTRPAWLQYKKKNRTTYHRMLLRSSFWKIELGASGAINKEDEMVEDYLENMDRDRRL